MKNETWKPVAGYEDRYEVSDGGNVRSLNYHMTGKIVNLRPIASGKGYRMVALCRNQTLRWAKVHRLVANAFIPNPGHKPQVNHINGDKTDNRAENLEWATESENMVHAYKNGLKKGSHEWGRILGAIYGKEARSKQAERCKRAVVAINIKSGEEVKFESAAEAERIIGVNHSSISKVCAGRQKFAKGYTFRYWTDKGVAE